MIIVSNTSPISNLAKVRKLDLIQNLYGRIAIPPAVQEELLDERAGETVITSVRAATWLDVHSVQNQALTTALNTRVNRGEAEAISLAIELQAKCLLIDERLGRETAKKLGLKVTGILGILLLAKQESLITQVKPIVDDLITQASFRISSQLDTDILTEAGE